ncbi:MAG: MarC family protein [Myxococcota bacterium]
MDLLSAGLLLFLIIDPFGNLPVYISTLERVPEKRRQRVLIRELLIALAILLAFFFAGRPVLHLMQLREPAVGIAGGIILFLIALRMVTPGRAADSQPEVGGEPLVVPLAVPLFAGPSVLATLLLFTSREPDHRLKWLGALLLAWLASSAILLAAPLLYRILTRRGLIALERLMGMILVALSVQMLLDGVAAYFGLPVPD